MFVHSFFEVGMDSIPKENEGNVLVGAVNWTGNFNATFEVDNVGLLRVLPGLNHLNSLYVLDPNVEFKTSEFVFTYSNEGVGLASRRIHDWARNYQVCEGRETRMTLLNNWENTFFDFNEELLGKLMKEVFSGDFLMKVGIEPFSFPHMTSRVIEV